MPEAIITPYNPVMGSSMLLSEPEKAPLGTEETLPMIAKKKLTYAIPRITGAISQIMLALNPSFLAVSSDKSNTHSCIDKSVDKLFVTHKMLSLTFAFFAVALVYSNLIK